MKINTSSLKFACIQLFASQLRKHFNKLKKATVRCFSIAIPASHVERALWHFPLKYGHEEFPTLVVYNTL